MRTYEVLKIVNFDGGRIHLDKTQAAARQHKLKKIKGDCYEITGRIQFKVGEIIGIEKEMIKRAHNGCLRDMSAQASAANITQNQSDDQPEGENTEETEGQDNAPSSNSEQNQTEDLETMHWKEIQKRVEAAGGEWVNKQQGIEFLRSPQQN